MIVTPLSNFLNVQTKTALYLYMSFIKQNTKINIPIYLNNFHQNSLKNAIPFTCF